MKLNETTAAARRVGPIRCVDDNGVAVVAGFSDPGAVEISVNDGAFSAAAGTVTVIGGGYVYYEATPADVSAQGFIVIKLSGICQESTFREEVEPAPQGIEVDTVDVAARRVGPLRIVDDNGVELATVVGITAEISINGSAWAAPLGSLSLIEDGYADYHATTPEVGDVGWIAIKLTGACQEFVFRVDVVEPSSGGGGSESVKPTEAVVSPAVGTVAGDYRAAASTPLIVDVTEANMAYCAVFVEFEGQQLKLCAYRRGAFESPFDALSSATDMGGGVLRLSIRHNTGWPPGDVTLHFDPVDTSGNISDP